MSEAAAASRRQDSQQLVRQWAILKLLASQHRAWSVKELAEQLKVTKSTIDRDLKTLEQEFALVEVAAGKQKKLYRIDERIRALDTLTFGPSELLAVYAAQAALGGMAGTPIHADLGEVMAKLRGFLSPRHNGGLDALVRVFATHVRGAIDYGAKAEVIDELSDSIARLRVVRLTYHSPWKASTRTHRVRPLRLVWHHATLYLLGRVGEHERITTFAVQRIAELEQTDETFPAPRGDVVEAHIERAFGIWVSDREEDVEVRFDKEVAWRVEERVFHPRERKDRLPDGSLRWRLRTSAQWEVIPWVQTFGATAELVAPEAWRAALRAQIDAMHARYARSP